MTRSTITFPSTGRLINSSEDFRALVPTLLDLACQPGVQAEPAAHGIEASFDLCTDDDFEVNIAGTFIGYSGAVRFKGGTRREALSAMLNALADAQLTRASALVLTVEGQRPQALGGEAAWLWVLDGLARQIAEEPSGSRWACGGNQEFSLNLSPLTGAEAVVPKSTASGELLQRAPFSWYWDALGPAGEVLDEGFVFTEPESAQALRECVTLQDASKSAVLSAAVAFRVVPVFVKQAVKPVLLK